MRGAQITDINWERLLHLHINLAGTDCKSDPLELLSSVSFWTWTDRAPASVSLGAGGASLGYGEELRQDG